MDPINVHIPVFYAVSKKLDLLIKEGVQDLERLEKMVKENKIELSKLSDGMIKRRWNSDTIAEKGNWIEQLDCSRKKISGKCEELIQQLDLVCDVLANSRPVIYRDGRRVSWTPRKRW